MFCTSVLPFLICGAYTEAILADDRSKIAMVVESF